LAFEGVRANAGASESSLAAVAEAFGAPLPDAMVRLWSAADGLVIEAAEVQIMSTSAVMKLLPPRPLVADWCGLGWLPFIDDNTFDYICHPLEAPLWPRMIEVPHGDGPRLIYRDLDSALAALLACARSGRRYDLYRHEVAGDYDDANAARSAQD